MCYDIKQNQTKFSKNCHPYNTRIKYGSVTSRMKDNLSDEMSKINVRTYDNNNNVKKKEGTSIYVRGTPL